MVRHTHIHHVLRHHKSKHKCDICKSKKKKLLEKSMLFVAAGAPLMNLPQIFKIFIEQNAAGVSLLSWVMYVLFTVPWIIYGFAHKEKPLIINYLLWFILDLTVVAGIVIYG